MTTALLDANVLIALANESHIHHERSRIWFGRVNPSFVACPITEGALIRHYFRETDSPFSDEAVDIIRKVHRLPGHQFWNDNLNYGEIDCREVIGYRQVTDVYLVALAKNHNGKLATMDSGVAELHPDGVVWIPTLMIDE